MVVGLLAIASIPTVLGTSLALREQKRQYTAAKTMEKFYLSTANVTESSSEKMYVTLRGGKAYLVNESRSGSGFRFKGYYFNYPIPDSEAKVQGLVSFVSEDPPALNWLYVDSETRQVRHGGRGATLGHLTGPWSWTEDEEFLTLEDAENFVAIDVSEEDPSPDGGETWALYYDQHGDLAGLPAGKDIVDVRLRRQLVLGIDSKYVRD